MHAPARRRAVITAATIAVLAVAGPVSTTAAFAEPSSKPTASSGSGKTGNDPSNDQPGHDDQWQAQRDPDGEENGGVDQPGGTGGVDKTDQDGNNGSGNDSDCEDDNNGKGVPGHCKDKSNNGKSDENGGGKPGEKSDESRGNGQGGDADDTSDNGENGDKGEGGAGDDATPGGPAVAPTESVAPDGRAPAVLGIERTAPQDADRARNDRGIFARTVDAVLPNTGAEAGLLLLVLAAIAAVVAGFVMVRRGRATS